jgi:hypothetical protein
VSRTHRIQRTLGIYQNAVASPLLLMALEPWMWSAAGLVGRTGHRRQAVLGTALVHSAHAGWMYGALRRNPALVGQRRWLAGHVALTMARCLLYPALAQKRSYWRSHADDSAFFMQAWTPIVLLGASGSRLVASPVAAICTGFASGAAVYVAGAKVNGERLRDLDLTVLRRVANYSVSSAMVGLVVRTVVTLLNDASKTLDEEQAKYRELYQAGEGWKKSARELVLREQEEQRSTLRLLRSVVERHLAGQPELGRILQSLGAADASDDVAVAPWASRRLQEMVEEARVAFPLEVELVGPSSGTLAPDEAFAVGLLLKNAFGNAVSHGKATGVRIVYDERPDQRVQLSVADNGRGFKGEPEILPGHGIGRTRAFFASLDGEVVLRSRDGGGAEVIACWSKRQG